MPESATQIADGSELPLSPEQERILLAKTATRRGADLMNLHTVLTIEGAVDVAALNKAFGQMCRDNDALRARLVPRPEGRRQVIHPDIPRIEVFNDFKDKASDPEIVRKFVSDLAWKEFDLEREVLIRAFLIPLSDREHIFGIVTCHFVSDATSHGIIWKQIRDWYAHFSGNADAPKPGNRRRYWEFVAERNRWEANDAAKDLPFWGGIMEGLAPPMIDRPSRPSPQEPFTAQILSKDELVKLQQFARAQRVAFFVVVLVVSFSFLLRFMKNDKIAMMVSRDGRHLPSYFTTIGHFSLACPMSTTRPPPDLTLRQYLQQMWKSWAAAMSRPWIPAKLDARSLLLAAPMFIGFLDGDSLKFETGGQDLNVKKYQILPAPGFKAPGNLMMFFTSTREGLEIGLSQAEAQNQLFDSDTVVRTLKSMFGSFIEAADRPLNDFIHQP